MTLTPEKRQAIYAALSALGLVVVTMGFASQSLVDGVLGIVQAVLGLAAVILASVNARSVAYKTVYAAAAAVIVALKVAGYIDEGQSAYALNLGAAIAAAAPLVIAALRTSPATPTGQPEAEYAPKHAEPEAA